MDHDVLFYAFKAFCEANKLEAATLIYPYNDFNETGTLLYNTDPEALADGLLTIRQGILEGTGRPVKRRN